MLGAGGTIVTRESGPDLKDRAAVVAELAKVYRPERITYLIISILALLMVVACTVIVIIRQGIDWAQLTLLFGSSGVISLACSRVLFMWSRAMEAVFSMKFDK